MRLPEPLAHDVGRGHGPRVVHAGRAEQPDRAEVLPVDGDRRHDDGTRRQRLETVLGADGDREPAVEDVAQKGHDDQLLFEDGEDGAHRLHGVEGLGQAGRAADEDLVGFHGALEGVERPARRADEPVDLGGPTGRDGPRLGERAPDQGRGEHRAGAGQRLVCGLSLEVDGPLLDGAVGEHHDQQGVQRRQADELDGADGGGVVRGTDDHGGVGGQLGEQARGPLEHRLHFAVDLLEELCHLAALDGPEDARAGQVVDEEAVALVGRDAAGTGVGLDQVALALERHHLRADGGRGHLHPGALATWEEPTGSAVPMYSVTTASKMAARRRCRARSSSATSVWGVESVGGVIACLALKSTECQGDSRGQHQDSRASGTAVATARSQSSPRRNAEMKASWGTSTRPMFFIFFLPSFCFSSSLRLRLMSPP